MGKSLDNAVAEEVRRSREKIKRGEDTEVPAEMYDSMYLLELINRLTKRVEALEQRV